MEDKAEYLKKNAYVDAEGVYRWKSNDRVPPEECLEGVDPETIAKCKAARDKDTDKFLACYRESMKDYEHSAEELYEMRAAFGPGAKVVNVITGKVTQL